MFQIHTQLVIILANVIQTKFVFNNLMLFYFLFRVYVIAVIFVLNFYVFLKYVLKTAITRFGSRQFLRVGRRRGYKPYFILEYKHI